LGNAVSPPATPSTFGTTLQPSPKEPTSDFSAFKPLALYPNKRSRIDDDGSYRDPPQQGLPRISHDSRSVIALGSPRPQYRLEPARVSLSAASDHSRHESAYAAPREHHTPSHYPLPQPAPSSIASHDRVQLQRPQLPALENMVLRPHEPAAPSTVSEGASRYSSRGSSPSWTQPHRAIESRAPKSWTSEFTEFPGSSGTTRHAPLKRSPPAYFDVNEEKHHCNGTQSTPSYSPDQSAYFVQNLYMYQNGKSRKRSNLPKQSTDLMKQWFDEHIQNPYPTEEQKKHFAAAAGINLTQVSLTAFQSVHETNSQARLAIGSSTTDGDAPN